MFCFSSDFSELALWDRKRFLRSHLTHLGCLGAMGKVLGGKYSVVVRSSISVMSKVKIWGRKPSLHYVPSRHWWWCSILVFRSGSKFQPALSSSPLFSGRSIWRRKAKVSCRKLSPFQKVRRAAARVFFLSLLRDDLILMDLTSPGSSSSFHFAILILNVTGREKRQFQTYFVNHLEPGFQPKRLPVAKYGILTCGWSFLFAFNIFSYFIDMQFIFIWCAHFRGLEGP